MLIQIVPGGYRDGGFSNHLVLTGLTEHLRQLGYRLQRVEKGESHERPALNINLRNPPPDALTIDIPVQLQLEPYTKQVALNVKVTLVGLRPYLDQNFGIKSGQELSVRAFLPNFDGDYVGPRDANPANAVAGANDARPRNRVMRAILARRGARDFRDTQLNRFGYQCAFSACALVDVLEAAHIRPYRSEADNVEQNGLLLRADLHTLFDLDLIAVHPDTLTIAVHAAVSEPQYRQFHGQSVRQPARGFDEVALRQRWTAFREREV